MLSSSLSIFFLSFIIVGIIIALNFEWIFVEPINSIEDRVLITKRGALLVANNQ